MATHANARSHIPLVIPSEPRLLRFRSPPIASLAATRIAIRPTAQTADADAMLPAKAAYERTRFRVFIVHLRDGVIVSTMGPLVADVTPASALHASAPSDKRIPPF